MPKLIVTNIASLDGHYEGPGGNVMVLPMDHSFDAYNAERLRAADTLLLGRTTYEGFKGFWPQMADNPDATPTHREISRLDDAIEKVVVSDSLSPDRADPWRETTRIVRRADAHEQIAALPLPTRSPNPHLGCDHYRPSQRDQVMWPQMGETVSISGRDPCGRTVCLRGAVPQPPKTGSPTQ